jgi:PhoH-like ATPase
LPGYIFHENEFIICVNEYGEPIDKFCYQNGLLRPVKFTTFSNVYTGKLKPRNIHQELAFDMLKDKTSTVKLVTGTWGTGKTMSLVVAALEAVEKGEFEKIIWVRNNVQVKDTDQIGALPGDEHAKLLPYLGPMMDHVGGAEGIDLLIGHGQLEVIPLAFLRGRSIRNAIIISSEAENLTKEHIQLLLGRVDKGSNLWMDADLKQRDRAVFEKSAGIETMIDRLKGEPLFGYVHLVKSERSETARLADKLN